MSDTPVPPPTPDEPAAEQHSTVDIDTIQDIENSTVQIAGRDQIIVQPGGTLIINEDGTPSADAPDAPPAPGTCPYKGLYTFTAADADMFFGRERRIAGALARLRVASGTPAAQIPLSARFLVVVGPSGCGKSSFVQAGLLPALARNALPPGIPENEQVPLPDNCARWPTLIIQPDAHPLRSLAAALSAPDAPPSTVQQLITDLSTTPGHLDLAITLALRAHPGAEHLVLVVDQFEELFTQCQDVAERRAFITALLTAVAPSTAGPLIAIVTLRADFYAQCASEPALRDALETCQVLLGPPGPEELRRAIEEPAHRGDWKLERGLVEVILRDVGDSPGALPLLSHALQETWHHRAGRTLTLSGYEAAGGVQSALAHTADQIFTKTLTDPQRTIARLIFLRLVEFSDVVIATRRRAALSELSRTPAEAPLVQTVLQTLADARLIIVDRASAEVAHEALFAAWPQLRDWLAAEGPSLQIQRRLTDAAHDWERLQRDSGALYRGARLTEATRWASTHTDALNTAERDFLAASQTAQQGTLIALGALAVLAVLALAWLGWTVLTPLRLRQTALQESVLEKIEGATLPAGRLAADAVPVAPFWLDRTEVSNAHYQLCLDAGACTDAPDYPSTTAPLPASPAAALDAFAAAHYCAWLGRRLPTEAEWDLAARGTDGRPWPWTDGAALDAPHANLPSPGFEPTGTLPVDALPAGANPAGVLQLAGNVWEWTATTLQDCPDAPHGYCRAPWNGQSVDTLAVRGGAWNIQIESLADPPFNVLADTRDESLGWRCAQSTPP